MDAPPSFTSYAARTQVQLSDQLTNSSYNNEQPPSVGSVAWARVQVSDQLTYTYTSYNNEHAPSVGSVAMAALHLSDNQVTNTFYNNERAPSMTTVNYRGHSQSAGESVGYDGPPSLSDVDFPDESYTEVGSNVDRSWLSLSGVIPEAGPDPMEMDGYWLPSSAHNPDVAVSEGGTSKEKRIKHVKVNSGTMVDDGYAWRKYGQKDILGAKFPRVYYRCRHKFTQGCRATKQVQRSNEDSALFEVTYKGRHICIPI